MNMPAHCGRFAWGSGAETVGQLDGMVGGHWDGDTLVGRRDQF
jgi:hypothetical protein